MCHFKVFHTAGQAEVNPAVQQGEVKGVLSGGGNADPHQLCGGALAPDEVSSSGVKMGVRIMLMPFFTAVRIKLSRMRQCSGENGSV